MITHVSPEQMPREMDDLTEAFQLLADADRAALPTRIAYEVVREVDKRLGTRHSEELNFNGQMMALSVNLVTRFDYFSGFRGRDEAALFDVIDGRLAAAGQTYQPQYEGWIQRRAERSSQP